MCDGYQPTGEDDHSRLDDEFLCEYVDGTMDPSVRDAFEEYLRANPALAEHVERLRHTRMLLCQYGCQCKAPQGLQNRLRRELACEMIRTQMPLFPIVTSRLQAVAAFTSGMVVMLVLGMMVGAAVFSDPEHTGVTLGPRASTGDGLLSDYQRASAIVLPQAVSSYIHPHVSSVGSMVGLRARAWGQQPVLAADTLKEARLIRRSDVAP